MLLACLCSTGDIVSEDEVIAQIETDKVTIDVKYSAKGTAKVTEVLVKEGVSVLVKERVLRVFPGDCLQIW
jgi:2-oxoglutarate dehydrogenase E2 component (dihydrolipoamide succinyltransferase)